MKNVNTVYGCYVSGTIHKWFSNENDAKAYVANPDNGEKFNNQFLAARYVTALPGELEIGYGDSVIWAGQNVFDSIAHKNDIPTGWK